MTRTALSGRVSEDTAYLVDDYPYGFRLRCQIRYWIETKAKFGQRLMSQTQNPKTGRWNKAKASQYSAVMVLTINDDNGHVGTHSLNYNDSEAQIVAYEAQYAHVLTEAQRATIKALRVHNLAMSKITFSCEVSDGTKPRQTREDQAQIFGIAHSYALRELAE